MVDPIIMATIAEKILGMLSPKPVDPLQLPTGGTLDMKPVGLPPAEGVGQGSKINEELLKADGQPPAPAGLPGPAGMPPADGAAPLPQAPPVEVDGSGFPGDVGPQLPEGGVESGEKMSMEAKMAIAAQLGSLMRGPSTAGPAPSGGPGINMQPVFMNTLRSLNG